MIPTSGIWRVSSPFPQPPKHQPPGRSSGRIVWAIGLGLLLPLVAGCLGGSDSNEETTLTPPLTGEQVDVIVPAGWDFEQRWDVTLSEWSARTGAEYTLEKADFADNDQDLLSLTSPAQQTESAKLVVVPLTRLAELLFTQALEEIPASQRDAGLMWDDVFQGLRDNVGGNEVSPTVIPISVPVMVCYYRDDLLTQAGLSPPKTWDEYQELLEKLDSWAPGLTAVEPWGDAYRTTTFLSRAVAYAQHEGHNSLYFDVETGEPLINTAGFVRALEVAQRAINHMPPAVLGYTPDDCRREILTGRAALAIAFETGPGQPPVPFGPEAVTDANAAAETPWERPEGFSLGFFRLPGSREVFNPTLDAWEQLPGTTRNQVSLVGFAGLVLGVKKGATAPQQLAGWSLAATLTTDEYLADFPPGTRSLCRESQISQPRMWVADQLTPGERGRYIVAVERTLQDRHIVLELPFVGRMAMRDVLTEKIGAAIRGELSPQDSLDQVASNWKEIVGKIGLDVVRTSYRRSLGLPDLDDIPR